MSKTCAYTICFLFKSVFCFVLYKISARALCGIALHIFKHYKCTNFSWARDQIASNRSNRPKAGPEYRSRLRTGQPRNRAGIPATEEIFCSAERSDRLWGAPNLMFSVYTSGAFPKGDTDRSHPSCYDGLTIHLLLHIFAWLSSIRWQILKPWAQENF